MNNAKYWNMIRLITEYNLDINIGVLPDNLKCLKCNLVLKDACVVPCGCRFCRVCIDELLSRGIKFCPGVSEDCGESVLGGFVADFRANKSVSRLVVKCPHNGCFHECQLIDMDEHLRVCDRKNVACTFYELGCKKILAAEEVSEHFQQENRSHCEILIGMIADINREMESLKRSSESSKIEIDILKRNLESSKSEIEMLKRTDESNTSEIEMLKLELVLKTGQIRTIIDQMEHIKNENILINVELKSIKEENAGLNDRVRVLSEKTDQEIDERRESDERDFANMIERVNKEITSIRAMIESNKDEVDTAMRSVKNDIRSINHSTIKSINDDIDSTKSQAPVLVTTDEIDASCEWTIDRDVGKTRWFVGDKTSEYFSGVEYPYKYRLASWNYMSVTGGELGISLHIYPGVSDVQLPWPFKGTVTIKVTDKSKIHDCRIINRECEISRPVDNHHSDSSPFKFLHSELIRAGLDLARGIHVSCMIIPFRRS